MITWGKIEKLIELSKKPLSPYLERVQIVFNTRPEPYYRFLYLLAKELNCNCLEIGVHYGVGSQMMARGTNGLVVGVDKLETNRAIRLTTLENNFKYIVGDSLEVFDTVNELTNGKIGLVYQDSSHHYLPSLKEYELYSEICNGVWICDDITPAFYNTDVDPIGKGMVQYFDELPGDKRLFENLHIGSIQGMILKG